jgi:hypothetical protein
MNMNKTLIALAIAAALPVAAQADATLSGTLTSKYKSLDSSIDTDSRLTVASSEVLTNGMTATASFSITADTDDDTENSGTATLAGDFGTLTAGSIDADGAFQAGDVGNAVANTTESTASTASSVYGIHFAGDMAGLSVAAQINASTNAAGVAAGSTKSSQFGLSTDLNGVTVGYSYASATADEASTANHNGIHEGQSAVGLSYSFGDLALTVGKVNYNNAATTTVDAVVSATYTITAQAMTIVAQADNSPSGDYQIDISYAVNDAFTIATEVDKGKQTSITGTYTDGDMTATVAKTDDGTTDASIALDYGNADLTFGRVGAKTATTISPGDVAEYTHVTYKVTF